MMERCSSEVEKVLLYIGDARARASRAAQAVAKDGADASVVAALSEAERELGNLHRRLTQETLYTPADENLKLGV